MDWLSITGIGASIGTAVSMLPQLLKILREKKAADISVLVFVSLLSGLALWVAYGILKHDWIIIIANGFSWLVNLATMILTIYYRRREKVISYEL